MSGKHEGGGGHGGGGSDRWLLTYADLITLLLVLFIVMYSMAKVDEKKFSQVAGFLAAAFGGGGGNMIINTGMGTGDGVNLPGPDIAKTLEALSKYKDVLEGVGRELAADFQRDGRFTVYMSERGVTISLAGSAAFDSGRADLKPEFLPLLDAIVLKLAAVPNDISIEGHTDSDPIHNAQFPSNWELSTARANSVRQYLMSRGISQERMIMTAYGETRPLFANNTAEGKAKNRRVDVVILRNKPQVDLGQQISQETKP